MKQVAFNALACPLDGLPLGLSDKAVTCANGHSFDIDRKGTLNLLPVQFKKSLQPGDSREMVAARRAFLTAGHYAPIAHKLNELVARYAMATQKDLVVLDAGCGEGYYTGQLAEGLAALAYDYDFAVAGLDISKDAIAAAASRSRAVQWLVATNARLPIQESSIDCVLSLFGFPVWGEFSRVLKRSGIVITADVGPEHLIELRRVLYPEINEKTLRTIEIDGFTEIESHRVQAVFALSAGDATAALIGMTPHAFRAKRENIDRAVTTGFPSLTLDVVFRLYHC